MNKQRILALIAEIEKRKLMFMDLPSCHFEWLSDVELSAVLDGLRLLCKE